MSMSHTVHLVDLFSNGLGHTLTTRVGRPRVQPGLRSTIDRLMTVEEYVQRAIAALENERVP